MKTIELLVRSHSNLAKIAVRLFGRTNSTEYRDNPPRTLVVTRIGTMPARPGMVRVSVQWDRANYANQCLLKPEGELEVSPILGEVDFNGLQKLFGQHLNN